MNRPRQSKSSYQAQQNLIPVVIPQLKFDRSAGEQVRPALPVGEDELFPTDEPVRRAIPVDPSMPGSTAEEGDTPEKIQTWAKTYLGGKKRKKKKTELDDEVTEETINQFADATDPETEAMNDIIKGYQDKLQAPAASFNSPGGYTFPGFFNG